MWQSRTQFQLPLQLLHVKFSYLTNQKVLKAYGIYPFTARPLAGFKHQPKVNSTHQEKWIPRLSQNWRLWIFVHRPTDY
jgi:hypothetical protein